jgi:hypothetical protein
MHEHDNQGTMMHYQLGTYLFQGDNLSGTHGVIVHIQRQA